MQCDILWFIYFSCLYLTYTKFDPEVESGANRLSSLSWIDWHHSRPLDQTLEIYVFVGGWVGGGVGRSVRSAGFLVQGGAQGKKCY